MKPLNEKAAVIVRDIIERAEELDVGVHRYKNGSVVVDAGVDRVGSLEAGRLYSEVCLGGLGDVSFIPYDVDGLSMPGLCVTTSRPLLACLASQYAGWRISDDDYFAMASGPGRILRGREPLLEEIGFTEKTTEAVLTLESDNLPSEGVTASIAQRCGVEPDGLYLVVARTNSTVASVQVVARVVETGMHKMHECGFDVTAVKSGWGVAPLAPVASNSLKAMGWTNDAVLYGGDVFYMVTAEDAAIESVMDKLPSSAASDFGVPFGELFKRYEGDFYKIDPLLFSPARITINNLSTGKLFRAGEPAVSVLKKEWGI